MTLQLPPYAEKVVSDYLREVPEVAEIVDRRVVGKTPSDTTTPWVRVTQIGGPVAGGPHHLIEYLMQFDCFAGKELGQPEANLLARTVHAALAALDRANYQADDTVVTGASANQGTRVPDTDFEPARERFVVSARIWMHRVPA